MSTLKTTNIAHPSSASNNIVLDASGNVAVQAGTVGAPPIYFTGDSNTGIYSPAADSVAVVTGGTQRATVDSSGRLLVGTSTARSALGVTSAFQVEGTGYDTSSLSLICNANSAGIASNLILGKSRGTSLGSNTVVQSGDTIGDIAFAGADGSDLGQYAAKISAEVDGTPGANDMPGRLVFSVTRDGQASPTEAARIRNDGSTSWFTTNAADSSFFDIRTSSGAGTTNYFLSANHSASGIKSGGTSSLLMYTNGNIQNTNGSYTTISDAKLKENIVDAGSQWDDLKAIQIRNWNFKAETGHETHRQIGPIAQELETVCPGLVFETPDRDEDGNETGEVTKGVNQSVLYMKAVKALQEAMERIEQLESEMAAVKAQLS